MEMTRSDGATLYLLKEDETLHFETLKNQSFKDSDKSYDPIPLSTKSIATDSLNKNETILIDDAYLIDREWDVNFNKNLDKEKHYRTRSVLAFPSLTKMNDLWEFSNLSTKKIILRKNGRRTPQLFLPCLHLAG